MFASDEVAEPTTVSMMPGLEFGRLWGSDQPQSYPDSGAPPSAHSYLPPVGGFRFLVVTMPPYGDGDVAEAAEERL